MQVRRLGADGLQGYGLFRRLFSLILLFLRGLGGQRPGLIVVLSDPPFLVLAGALLGLLRGVPVVHWCHDLYPEALRVLRLPGLVRLLRPLNRWACNRCALVVTPSQAMAESLRRDGVTARIETLPNWPEQGLAAAELATGEPLTVLYSGHYGRCHDLRALITAAVFLQAANTPVQFRLALNRRDRDRLLRDVGGLEALPDNVRLEAPVAAADLLQHLASAHLHVASMRDEAAHAIAPCKAESAWRVGRPLLLLGGEGSSLADDVTRFGLGKACATDDGAGIAAWLQELASDPTRLQALADNAREFGEQRLAQQPCGKLARRIAALAIAASVRDAEAAVLTSSLEAKRG